MYPYDESVSLKPVIWMVVADGKEMRVSECHLARRIVPREGTAKHLYSAEEMQWELTSRPELTEHAESPKDYQMEHDHRGSIFGRGTSVRHTVEPHINIPEELKHRFMKAIAEKLREAHKQKYFDHLIIAAPPKLLGDLRDHLDSAITAQVIAEIPKELGHCSAKELLDHAKPALDSLHARAA